MRWRYVIMESAGIFIIETLPKIVRSLYFDEAKLFSI